MKSSTIVNIVCMILGAALDAPLYVIVQISVTVMLHNEACNILLKFHGPWRLHVEKYFSTELIVVFRAVVRAYVIPRYRTFLNSGRFMIAAQIRKVDATFCGGLNNYVRYRLVSLEQRVHCINDEGIGTSSTTLLINSLHILLRTSTRTLCMGFVMFLWARVIETA